MIINDWQALGVGLLDTREIASIIASNTARIGESICPCGYDRSPTYTRPLPRSIWKLDAYVRLSAMYMDDVENMSHIAGTINRNHFDTGIVTDSRPPSENRRQIQ